MSNFQLPLQLSNPSRSTLDLLFLEQIEEQDTYVGRLTVTGMVQGVLGFLYPEGEYETANNCGGDDSIFDTIVYAYLYQQNLDYDIGISYGEISERQIQETEYLELIQIGLRKEVDFSYPSEGIISTEWVGPTYNELGETIPAPTFTDTNRGLTFSDRVYGSLRVRYKVIRHRYGITITSRNRVNETFTEDKYKSTTYANWVGGITWVEIEAPFGFEAWDGDCGNGSILFSPPPDDPSVPKAPQTSITNHQDYCSGEMK